MDSNLNYNHKEENIFSDVDRNLKIDTFGNLIVYTDDKDVISQSIKNILSTPVGSRVRFPEFGTSLKNFLFELIDEDLIDDIQTDIKEALETWENRITVQDVSITVVNPDHNLIELTITYFIHHNGQLERFIGRISPPQ